MKECGHGGHWLNPNCGFRKEHSTSYKFDLFAELVYSGPPLRLILPSIFKPTADIGMMCRFIDRPLIRRSLTEIRWITCVWRCDLWKSLYETLIMILNAARNPRDTHLTGLRVCASVYLICRSRSTGRYSYCGRFVKWMKIRGRIWSVWSGFCFDNRTQVELSGYPTRIGGEGGWCVTTDECDLE